MRTCNLKLLIPVLVFAAIISCNQPSGKEDPNSKTESRYIDTSAIARLRQGVYFVNLKDGEQVKSPLIVQMGVKGMEVEPAGKVNEMKGHHHLIIDGSFVEKGQMVPKDETHLHFGKGQTTDTLKLSPGSHTLTLQFADGMHRSYGKDWSSTITINVGN
jgi:hypothetical protein